MIGLRFLAFKSSYCSAKNPENSKMNKEKNSDKKTEIRTEPHKNEKMDSRDEPKQSAEHKILPKPTTHANNEVDRVEVLTKGRRQVKKNQPPPPQLLKHFYIFPLTIYKNVNRELFFRLCLPLEPFEQN